MVIILHDLSRLITFFSRRHYSHPKGRAGAKTTTLKHGQDATRGATSPNRDLDFRRQPFLRMCQTTKKEQKCVYFLLLPFVYPSSARPCPNAFLSIIHYPLSHVEFFLYRTLGAPFGAPPLPHPRRFRYCVGHDPRMRRHLKLGPPVVRLQKHFDVMRGSQLRLRRPLLGDLAHPPARNEAPMPCPPAPQEPRRQLVE